MLLGKHKEVDGPSHHLSGTHLGEKRFFPSLWGQGAPAVSGEFSSDLYGALVCDIIIRKSIILILYFSGLLLMTPVTFYDIKSVWATLQNTLLLEIM